MKKVQEPQTGSLQYVPTLAFRDGEWELIEYEEPVIGLMNLAEPIVPAGDEDIPIFTVMHREKGL